MFTGHPSALKRAHRRKLPKRIIERNKMLQKQKYFGRGSRLSVDRIHDIHRRFKNKAVHFGSGAVIESNEDVHRHNNMKSLNTKMTKTNKRHESVVTKKPRNVMSRVNGVPTVNDSEHYESQGVREVWEGLSDTTKYAVMGIAGFGVYKLVR